MRSKGSRFTLGVWELRVCSLDVAFTVATVRNRPREYHMAVPMGSFAEAVLFGGFRRVVVSFRVAGVALGDIEVHSAYADARRGGKIQQPNNVLDSTKAKNHKENAANVCQHLGIPRFLMNHGQHRVQFCLILQCC